MIFKTLKYYQDKARINKASNQSTAYQIQLYNDRLIDQYVESFDSNEDLTVKPSNSHLWGDLSILNRPDVYRNYQRIINSKYTSNDAIDNILIKNKANKDLERIVTAEVERISKNLDYVEQVMRKYNAPFEEYKRLIDEQGKNSVGKRQEILKEVAIKSNNLLTSDGLNIPSNVYSYRNLEATAENLLRQSQMISQHEKINSINENYLADGKDKVYNGKEWIWTGAGKTTRHYSNHLQKRSLNEPFIITNDATLEIDDLMYPSDPNGSFGNTFVCYCDVEYLTDYIDEFGYKGTTYSGNNDSFVPTKTSIPEQISYKESKIKPKIIEPTSEQLKAKLSKEEIKEVEWAKNALSSEFITEKGKEIARQTLDELYKKTLGEPVKTTTSKPNTKTAIKPTTKSVKTTTIEEMSSQELYDSMTKADKKKYTKAKEKLASAEKNIKTLGENELLLEIKKDRLLELNKLEQKQRDKLANKGKPKPKKETIRTHERTINKIHNEVEIPTTELIPTLETWINKRHKNVAEFGYQFDIKTGKILGNEIRGKKGQITISDMGKDTGSIHSHPNNGMSAPSIADLETFRCKQQQHHFMVSEHEIWYVKATDSFGIGAMGQQLDLQRAHKSCRDKAFKRVEAGIKKGEIEASEKAIAKKLDEFTGDEILKTFNSPPWSKTLTIKRYYR